MLLLTATPALLREEVRARNDARQRLPQCAETFRSTLLRVRRGHRTVIGGSGKDADKFYRN